MLDPKGRVNFYFDRTEDGRLAYEFLHKCKSRNKARFVARLINDFLRHYGINNCEDIDGTSSEELDRLITDYLNGKPVSQQTEPNEEFINQVIIALRRKGISLHTESTINSGSMVDPENKIQDEKKQDSLSGSTVDPDNKTDQHDAVDEMPVNSIEDEIEDFDDIDIPDDFSDALNMFK